ncbi:hypothetical protein J7315_08165 [Providencia rettgeri]|uniref:hypothetical protein n=1 Tax=Providencia rettgeri TaxID=587 RepID=UPI001B378EDC|nr:hypothetical protein [Providencia rettgeri]MBQ0686040.1 hypothetical protein [Providencia rettgeri]
MHTTSITHEHPNSEFIDYFSTKREENQSNAIFVSNGSLLAPLLRNLSEKPLSSELIEVALSEVAIALNTVRNNLPQQQILLSQLEEAAPGSFSNCIPENADWNDAIKPINSHCNKTRFTDITSLLIELIGKVGESMRKRGEQVLPLLCTVYMVNYALGHMSAGLINQSTINSSKQVFTDALKKISTSGVNYHYSPENKNHPTVTIPEINKTTSCKSEVLNEGVSSIQQVFAQQLNDYTELGNQITNISHSILDSLESIDSNTIKSLINDTSCFINIDDGLIASAISNNDNAYLNFSRK